MSTGKCGMPQSEKCSKLLRMIDKKQKNMINDTVGLYKKDFLVGHIPIEILSLYFHFINQDPGKKSTDNWKTTMRNWTCRSGKGNFHNKQ